MRKGLIYLLPISLIILAEILFFNHITEACLALHALNIFLCILLPLFIKDDYELFPIFVLISMLRVLNIGMPFFFKFTIYWLPLIYAPVIAAGYIIWRESAKDERRFSLKKLAAFVNGEGLGHQTTWKWSYIPLAIGIGLVLSIVEYAILGPGSLIPDASLLNLIVLMLVMVCAIGFGEELVFRALLQTKAEPWLGIYGAMLLSAFLFSVMHSGYSSIPYLIFVFAVGLILAFIYLRTRSLALVSLIHGFLNFFLFSFLPLGWTISF